MPRLRLLQPFFFLLFMLVLSGCIVDEQESLPAWNALPGVISLNKLKQTDFVVTLESQVPMNKNIIYAPAFLYAWDQVKKALKSPIVASGTNSADFNLLNQSTSHLNSLTEEAYTATAEVDDGVIVARAFFNQTLPFQKSLHALEEPLLFDTTNVSAFGMYYYDEDIVALTQILYYKNDSNFILKLIPEDKHQEIILVKGLDGYPTFDNAIQQTNKLISEGKTEQAGAKLSWKYQLLREDIFAIPSIKFNIEKNYNGLEGQSFLTKNNNKYFVEEAYQRTGFILNENGAMAESQAIVVITDSAGAAPITTHPKKMIFDRPFLILIKRTDKPTPYFVMQVANAELLMRK